ncbi:hypothetical protein AA313_de0202610 [Arthrobotrys entomopaga]|nr:hypothetical protein AA313_de0202610 [Arthrobotrys entomopaga]
MPSFKLRHKLLIILTTALQFYHINAWSFKFLHVPPLDASRGSTTVRISPKACAYMTRSYVDDEQTQLRKFDGVSVLQGEQTDPKGLTDNLLGPNRGGIIEYLGFWTRINCAHLPTAIVHFYPLPNTLQVANFSKIGESRENFESFHQKDWWTWAEIGPNSSGDSIFLQIPPGAIAYRIDESETKPAIDAAANLQGHYIIVEDAIAVKQASADDDVTLNNWQGGQGEFAEEVRIQMDSSQASLVRSATRQLKERKTGNQIASTQANQFYTLDDPSNASLLDFKSNLIDDGRVLDDGNGGIVNELLAMGARELLVQQNLAKMQLANEINRLSEDEVFYLGNSALSRLPEAQLRDLLLRRRLRLQEERSRVPPEAEGDDETQRMLLQRIFSVKINRR